MEVQKRLYTVDDVCELQGWDGRRDSKYELIDGELFEISPANSLHAWIAMEYCPALNWKYGGCSRRARLNAPRPLRNDANGWPARRRPNKAST